MRLLIAALLSIAALLAGSAQPPSAQPKIAAHNQGRGARSTASTARPSPGTVATKGSSAKPVHVRQYTRKDGTVVRAHDRAAPGSKSKGGAVPKKTRSRAPSR